MMQKSHWLAIPLMVGLITSTNLAAQNPSVISAQEAGDSARLIEALNTGSVSNTLQILRAYGVSERTLARMAVAFGKPPARSELKEPFLKVSAEIPLGGNKTNAQTRLESAASLGYRLPTWLARWQGTNWMARCDSELSLCPIPPVALLDLNLDDSAFLRHFLWYDRYAERLHSVVLNGDDLTNAKIEPGYERANRSLNALYRLIKARKPDAFVWLEVVKQDSHSDERWLKAMTFTPDGLQISNLRQFHSPFAETRRRYVGIVGTNMPMMVAGFFGYKAALQEKGRLLSDSKRITNPTVRVAATTEATAQIGGIGSLVGQDLAQAEVEVAALGYRGLSAHSLLIEALANQDKAAGVVDRSSIVDRRAGLLAAAFAEKDYDRVATLAKEMFDQSTPGHLNWVIARTYQAMLLLSQTPVKPAEAAQILDEVLAYDFRTRPEFHYQIVYAAQWRMHAAMLTGDRRKAEDTAQWVRDNPFRADVKSDFLKRHGNALKPQSTQSN